MSLRKLHVYLIFLVLALPLAAQGANLGFAAPTYQASPGETLQIDLIGDFTGDGTLGGGLDIFYDAAVIEFLGFDFDSATLPLDPTLSRKPDVLTDELEGLAFGNFVGIGDAGRVGTLSFKALAAGSTQLVLAVTDNLLKGGPFVSADTFGEQAVDLAAASVTVAPVPLPAAAWLMAGALAGVAMRRRRAASQRPD